MPPRWFIRLAWYSHRALYRISRGRVGLWRPRRNRWGTLRLTTTGRRTGRQRSVILGYIEDGPNLVTMAMSGWGEGEPARWLNLQAHPHGDGRSRRRATQGALPGSDRGRAGAVVEPLARDRRQSGRLRGAASV